MNAVQRSALVRKYKGDVVAAYEAGLEDCDCSDEYHKGWDQGEQHGWHEGYDEGAMECDE